MRVCHIASGDVWAGAEAQVAALLGALRAFPELELSAVLLNRGRLHDELARLGIPVAVCDESRAGIMRLFLETRRRLREFRPEILHTHGYKENVLGAAAGRASCRPRLVQTYHGIQENLTGWAGAKMRWYDRLNSFVGRLAGDAFIGVSSEIAQILRERYPGKDVRCIRNGIDVGCVAPSRARDAVRERIGVARDAFVVGTVGRLMPVKAFDRLIAALAQLRRDRAGLDAQLVIVGDGPLRRELVECAKRLGVSGQTTFVGARSDVYDLMAAFDVFALPSLHEGIPMVILEAMAIGVPIVANRVGGIPEILEDGRDALLVEAAAPGALAHAIGRLAADPSLRAALARSARRQAEARFSITATAASVVDLYCSLAERRNS
jgi:L-malate glycosyltransferase